jgi:hypothetical protein
MADKDNIQSPSVEKLIPQQMVGDSQALIEFLKEYYRFLNQDNEPIDVVNKIIQNKDLDDAVDSYIDMIRKELGYGMVRELEANKINLYKHIGEFYRAKGSIDSFKLLFKLLFNKNVEISLPKEQILVASDGRWVQQTSLFAEVASGNAFDLVNNFIVINNPSGTAITVEVERVRKYNDQGIYEIVISRLFVGEIENNSTFSENGVTGIIVNSLSGFTIDYPGKNFKVGQLLDVVYGRTIGTKIKVTSVNTEGGITGIEFLNFGVGYPEEFSSQLVPVGFDYNFNIQETVPGDPSALTFSGRLNEIISVSEYTFLEINPYSSGYFAQDYLEGSRQVGDLSAAFDYSAALNQQNLEDNSDVVKAAIESEYPNRAIITFTNKPVSKYAGSYSTNKGFLSDDIYLQDNYYYQQFSYVIKTDEQFSQYESLVKQTVHPTGMIMFGEFEITNEIDARAAIELLGRLYRQNYQDSVRTDEEIQDVTIIKPIPVDGEIATTSQFVYYEFIKPLEDEVFTPDDDFYKLTKPLQHQVLTPEQVAKLSAKPFYNSVHIDDDPVFEDFETVYAVEYFAEVYSEGLSVDRSRGFYWELTKPVVEEMITSETTDYEFTKSVEEEMITSQTVDYELTKPLFSAVDANHESVDRYITKPLEENTTILENYDNTLSKPFSNSIIGSDSYNPTLIKPFLEQMTTSEVDPIFSIDKSISEIIVPVENRSHHISKPLAQEHINNTEFGMAEINPYSAFYFSESYVEGHTAFS